MTFTTEKNGIVIKTTLYGPVSPERLVKETQIAQHRVEQLQPAGAPKRERDDRGERRGIRETTTVWDSSYQSTGR